MFNYAIPFEENNRDDILRILDRNNDIIVDRVMENKIVITIETSNHEEVYNRTLEEVRALEVNRGNYPADSL